VEHGGFVDEDIEGGKAEGHGRLRTGSGSESEESLVQERACQRCGKRG
jgi:hypothetical protein